MRHNFIFFLQEFFQMMYRDNEKISRHSISFLTLINRKCKLARTLVDLKNQINF